MWTLHNRLLGLADRQDFASLGMPAFERGEWTRDHLHALLSDIHWLSMHGRRRFNYRSKSEEEKAAILAAYDAGEKLELIATRFNVSSAYARGLARKAGRPPRPLASWHYKHKARMERLRKLVEREEYSGSAYRASEQNKQWPLS